MHVSKKTLGASTIASKAIRAIASVLSGAGTWRLGARAEFVVDEEPDRNGCAVLFAKTLGAISARSPDTPRCQREELRLQARSAGPQAAAELLTAADRLIVLSKVHQRLSRHGHSALVDLHEFLQELCSDLDATLLGVRAISLTCNIARLQVASGEAVAIGLIVNELLTNAVKYPFAEGRTGKIDLSVGWAGQHRLEIRVADNGRGFDASGGTGGLGQKLIRSLAAQLDGCYECASGTRGTECVVRFRPSTQSTS